MSVHDHFAYWIVQAEEGIPAEVQAALDEHLCTCAACRQLAADWAALAETLEQVTLPEPPPALAADWLRLAAQRNLRLQRRSLRVFVLILSLGSVASFLLLFWVWWQAPAWPILGVARMILALKGVLLWAHIVGKVLPVAGVVALVALGTAGLLTGLSWMTQRQVFAFYRR